MVSPIYGGWGKRQYNPGAAIDAFTAINAAMAEGAHDLGIRSVYYDAMGMFKGVGTGLTAGNNLAKEGGYETTGKNAAGEFEITWHKSGKKTNTSNRNRDENGYSKKSSLYTIPNGEGTHSVEEWAEHYEGKSWKGIVTDEKGPYGDGYQRIKLLGITILKAPYGPTSDWRYVKLDDGRVLDMRHVLVVGMNSEFLGAAGEYVQYLKDGKSANSIQDYVSNAAGAQFLNYLQGNAPYYNPLHSTTEFGNNHQIDISQYFYKFIYGL